MNIQGITEETIKKAMALVPSGHNPQADVTKALDTTTGLIGINLDAPAKQLVPLLSPLRTMIPRTTRSGSTSSQWRAITALSNPKLSVAESAAGAAFTTTVTNKTATYKSFGLRGQVTREAIAASEGFDPALQKETANTLLIAMKLEDIYILGGNVTALAAPAAPTVAAVVQTGVGTIATGTYFVTIAALTLPALNRLTVNVPTVCTDSSLTGVTAANVAASTAYDTAVAASLAALTGSDGVRTGSEGNSGAITGTQNQLKITWSAVPGAAGYMVIVGTSSGVANGFIQCVVTQTAIQLTSVLATNIAGAAAATSADSLSYDGMIPQILASGSGAYVKNLAGRLTTSGGEIAALQDAFAAIWSNAKIGDFTVFIAGQEARTLSNLSIAAGGGPTIFVSSNDSTRMDLTQGYHIGSIINATTGMRCPVVTLPWLANGTILVIPNSIPYPDANAPSPFDMSMGFDWERIDYYPTTSTGPVFPFEIRCYGALRGIYTGGCGIIYNAFNS